MSEVKLLYSKLVNIANLNQWDVLNDEETLKACKKAIDQHTAKTEFVKVASMDEIKAQPINEVEAHGLKIYELIE